MDALSHEGVDRRVTGDGLGWWVNSLVNVRKALGMLLTANFLVLWAAPVILQGQAFRRGFDQIVRPVYRLVEYSQPLRRFAAKHVYQRAAHVEYFAAAILLILTMTGLLVAVFAWQIAYGSLPWWLVAIYYLIWVGPGGRGMATAWTLAHREGHMPGGELYRQAIGKRMGNFFENWLGVFYGTVPYNFSTSHILLHHRLNGGKGDPIYLWDLDRTCLGDMMLYQWRFFLYMTGVSSMIEFQRQRGVHPVIDRARSTLARGMLIFWVLVPAGITALLLGTGSSVQASLLFVFLIYLQPLFAMTTFLTIINVGSHSFLEFDDEGKQVRAVTSITILEGLDDSFGEDHHLEHHHFPSVNYKELADHAATLRPEWARCHGAVFEKTTFFEIAIHILLGKFDRLVRRYYVDYAGDLDVEELAALFEKRAKRTEMSYVDYEFRYLPGLRQHVRDLVRQGTCKDENRGYIHQAHFNLPGAMAAS